MGGIIKLFDTGNQARNMRGGIFLADSKMGISYKNHWLQIGYICVDPSLVGKQSTKVLTSIMNMSGLIGPVEKAAITGETTSWNTLIIAMGAVLAKESLLKTTGFAKVSEKESLDHLLDRV